jgi:hypothetical protein
MFSDFRIGDDDDVDSFLLLLVRPLLSQDIWSQRAAWRFCGSKLDQMGLFFSTGGPASHKKATWGANLARTILLDWRARLAQKGDLGGQSGQMRDRGWIHSTEAKSIESPPSFVKNRHDGPSSTLDPKSGWDAVFRRVWLLPGVRTGSSTSRRIP